MKRIDDTRLHELLAAALIVQAETGSLTIQACTTAWGYATTSAAAHVMAMLVKHQMVRAYPRGTHGGHTYLIPWANVYRVAPEKEATK